MSRPRFTAATWNLRYDVPAREQMATLARLQRLGVTVALLQEVQAAGIVVMLREAGWRLHRVGECAVIWRPDVWTYRSRCAVVLSDSGYDRVGGAHVRPTAAAVLLEHTSGRTVEALSYHLPAGVQRAGIPNQHAPRRVAVVREAMRVLAARARASEADAILYGGDDNIDEDRGSGWGFMRRWATGLRLVRAPRGTHGSRAIDDFRVKRLKPLRVWTIPTPGDHRAVVGEFRFRR